jgi:hypothetical protein
VSESHDEPSAQPPTPPRRGDPSPFGGDTQKLREALIAFLNRDQADWDALSRDLHALASSSDEAANARLQPLVQPPAGSGARQPAAGDETVSPEEARAAWRALAQYLAHHDRAQGVPHQVHKLLESDVAARAAAAAFAQDLASQRDEWLDFARQIERTRKHKRKGKH